ncbi:MAG TPA: sugar phosphate isomerase/epimerase [Clostridiales bacterium]|nr:sugar phosphate isomerase/epimerase [Clostridiales bacterium]
MKVQISGFYDEVTSDFNKQMALAKKLGGEYICPRNVDGKNIANYSLEEFQVSILPRMKENDIKFSSIGSPIGKIGINDEQGYEKQKKQLETLIRIAKKADCKYIRVFSFFYGKEDPDSCLDKVVEKMRGFLEIAKGSGVTLLHENEKKIFGDVPSRVLKLYENLKDDGLQFIFDSSNFVQCDVNVKEAFEQLKDIIVYYHIKDCSEYKVEVPLGVGLGEYQYIIDELKKRNYEGFMTLEPHTWKYAVLKPLVYFIPFMPLIMNNYFKAFRLIDKAKGINFFKCVSRQEVFEWQFKTLEEMIKE